ncbi:apoptotic chromatin condensation inducer in the nucleus isoform X2 [Carettochelys insculpta]|uniref:apoptotic chromatin condensation inducer in the nucleus isoform X2 n=1 Tax=Carettochelys insculpta TaxID=44489 RepID=UPI003EB7EA7D
MADGEEVTLDGRPLQALRVADLKAALQQRGLAKSGQKSALIKRLRGALMLENLQKHSTLHATFQPNSQIGEEMSQNSFIKQYLEKQHELLQQRLQREAREAAELEASGKSCPVSRDRSDSDEEGARRQERRSTRVRQARASKAPEGAQAAGPEEREAAPRGRRGTPRTTLKVEEDDEEEEEEDEEEEEEDEEEEEEEEEETAKALEGGGERGASWPPGFQASGSPQEAGGAQEKAGLMAPAPQQTRVPGSPLPQEEERPEAPAVGGPKSSGPQGRGSAQAPAPGESQAPDMPEPLEGGMILPSEPHGSGVTVTLAPQEKGEPSPPAPQDKGEPSPPAPQEKGEPCPPAPQEKGEPSPPAPQEKGEPCPPAPQDKGEPSPLPAPQDKGEPSPPARQEKGLPSPPATQDKGEPSPPAPQEKRLPSPPAPQDKGEPSPPDPPLEDSLEKKGVAGLQEDKEDLREEAEGPPEISQEGGVAASSRSPAPPQLSEGEDEGPPPQLTKEVPPIQEGLLETCLASAPPASQHRRRGGSDSDSDSSSSGSRSSRSESPPRKRQASRSSSSSSRKSRSPEASLGSPAHHQEALESPRAEGRAPLLAPQRHPSRGHRPSPESLRGSSETPGGPAGAGSGGDPPGRAEQRQRKSSQEEKEEAPMEVEPHQAAASPPTGPPAQLPGPDERPDGGPEDEDRKEAAAQHKAFKRKISLVSAAKGAVAGNSDTEGGPLGGRKRRWGASTATTQKKPSISITTESLKSLIPEMKPAAGQEAVVDLHADDSRLSEDEGERHGEPTAHEKGLKICRTVTQVVLAEGQENGQGEEEEEEEKEPEEEQPEAPQVTAEVPLPPPVEHEVKKVTLSDTLTRRSISQQRSGVSITIDDPVRTAQFPSPPRAKPSPIVHICNLVRPFTLAQLKELLGRTGTLVEDAFWIDKIKSHCYVTYSTVEEAVLTRNALHGVKWPQSNPKFLAADFAEQDELDFHRGLLAERAEAVTAAAAAGPGPVGGRGARRSAPREERSREPERAVREQWAEREREMERRERTRAEREWDRDKVREGPRSRSRERRRKELPKAKEKKAEKKEKAPEEPPAKLLDDLFRKTKAAPCIYWLPLTDTQFVQKQAERAARARERERRRKELEEEESRQQERSRQAERERRREHSRERGARGAAGGAGGADRGGRERREAKRHSRSRSHSTPVRDRGGRR